MESPFTKFQLLFCKTCGLQRLCDVTEELQKLFTEKYLEPNTCGICQKQVEQANNINKEKSAQQSGMKEEQINDGDGQNDDYDLRPNLRVAVKKDKLVINNKVQDDEVIAMKIEPNVDIDEGHKSMQMEEDPELVASPMKSELDEDTDEEIHSLTQEEDPELMASPMKSELDEDTDEEIHTLTQVADPEQVASSTAMKSERNEDIDEEVHRLMQMEEDPEMVASSTLLEGTNEDFFKFLDPELLKVTLPSDDPKKPLKCKVCNAAFGAIQLFANHVSDHTDKGPMQKPLKCPDCGKNYPTKSFQQHRGFHFNLKTPQQCIYKGCKFAFKELRVFKSHLDVHKGDKRHCCKVCGAGYLRKRDLSVHEQVHSSGPKRFRCRYCENSYSTSNITLRHERKVHDHQDILECDECGLKCSTEYSLKRHKQSHKTKLETDFVCAQCGACFTDQVTLDQHALNACEAPFDWEGETKFVDPRLVALMDKPRIKSKPFRCKQCPRKECRRLSLFLYHVKYKHDCPVTHVYTCDQCDMKFDKYSEVEDHSATHSHDLTYMCDLDGCNKHFKTPTDFRKHKLYHKDDKRQHTCHICGVSFRTTSTLTRHVNGVHFKNNRPYKCTYCDSRFLWKGMQQRHEKLRHLNERRFVCEVCGKSFKEKTQLVTHNYSHTGERPFACHLCEYRCVRRDYLTNHMRLHTGKRPYRCELCETTCMHKSALNYHMKKVH
ncbi:zinc finger protein 532-like [Amphiura filiformis]|uniref:zinc finger protein 532-like n=1 Tax=Amphiura filiformis TaxID=82378 RepID=UPI003B221DB6